MANKLTTLSFILNSPAVVSNCMEAVANAGINGNIIVTLKDEKETRSGAQHRLRWLWMGFLEKELSGVNQFAQDVSFSLKKAVKAVTDNPNFVKWFKGSRVLDKENNIYKK